MRSDAPTNLYRPSATATPTQLVRECMSACYAMHCDAPTNSTTFRASTPTVGGAMGRSLAALRRRHSTSFQLVRLVELVEVLENKPETHHQPGTNSTDPRALSGSSGRNGSACHPYRPNNPRACVDTSSNNDRLELAGLSVQSLRAEPALALAPAVIFTDPCRHARRHARKHACSVLITKRRSGAITPDRQPVPSVRSVGDGGGRGKKRSVPGYAPLCVHNFFGIDEAGRCTNP